MPINKSVRVGWLVLAVAMAGCDTGKSVGSVSLPKLGEPGESKIALRDNTNLIFAIQASNFESSGTVGMVLDIELLRDGKSVGTTRCDQWKLKGSRSSGPLSYLDTNCAIAVPAGGASAVRATLRTSTTPKQLTLTGISIDVRRYPS